MMHLRSILSPTCIAIVTAVMLLSTVARGQFYTPESQLPQGESVQGNVYSSWETGTIIHFTHGFNTQHHIYSIEHGFFGEETSAIIWTPPEGDEIKGIFQKSDKDIFHPSNTYFVVTTDGHMYQVSFEADKSGIGVSSSKEVTYPGNTLISKIRGDDLYAIMADGSIYVTHNDTTWQIDTTGLNSASVYEAALDSLQNVYIATSKGIFKQALNATGWQTLASSFFDYIYVTKDSRIFASTYDYLTTSTDLGATWNSDTVGLSSRTVTHLTEDTAGTLYAVTSDYSSGDHLWQQKRGGNWQQIDIGPNLSYDPTEAFINDITVDSGIYIATKFGEFFSGDNGANWTPIAQGVGASNIYSFLELPNGNKIITTSLGLYSKGPADTIWTKRFPQNQYLSGIKTFVDNAGRLYALGLSRTLNYSTLPQDIYISDDAGLTWQPDTAGFSTLSSGTEFIDETGAEHLANYGSTGPKLFVKMKGGSWQGDSSGYISNSGDGAGVFASDHHGWLYLTINNTTNPRLIKRPIGGGTWMEVQPHPLIELPYAFTATKDGKLVGGNSNTAVGYYDGTSWTVIPNPPGLTNPSGYPESVDSSNRLWVIYGTIDQSSYYTPYGVYWTSDLGQHWTKAADGSNNFSSLVSFGDTTYGLNGGNGLVYFVPGSAGVFEQSASNAGFSIVPNPSMGPVTFRLNNLTHATIEIFDVLGNKLSSAETQGTSSFNLRDAGGNLLPSGIYVARVAGTDENGQPFRASKQFAIER